jgi:glycosyltransferase involved in cell wall biosynthesis
MNIALLTPLPPGAGGGVESFTALLIRILEEAGHQIKVFDSTCLNKKYRGIFNWKLLGYYKLAYDLGREFNKERAKFDLVMCNGIFGWSVQFPKALAICHGNIGAYGDSIRTNLSLLHYWKIRYMDLWFHTKSFRGKSLVVVSRKTGQECEKYHDLHKYVVIENAVDTAAFRPRYNKAKYRREFHLDESRFLGLFVGRDEYRKGLDVVAAMAAQLGDGHGIVAAMPGRSSALDKVKNVVQITGVPRGKMSYLYNACDYFLLPSRHEGCSIALLEALASGLPIVATRVGNAADIASRDEIIGRFIVDAFAQAEVFRRKIEILRMNKGLRAELKERGRNYAVRYHGLELFKGRYLQLINELIGKDERDASANS